MQLYNRSIKTLESLNFIYRQVQVCSTRNSMEGTMKAKQCCGSRGSYKEENEFFNLPSAVETKYSLRSWKNNSVFH